MDISAITHAISSVGFPIVCVVFMWKYINTTVKELTEVIRNNTEILKKIEGQIGDDKND